MDFGKSEFTLSPFQNIVISQWSLPGKLLGKTVQRYEPHHSLVLEYVVYLFCGAFRMLQNLQGGGKGQRKIMTPGFKSSEANYTLQRPINKSKSGHDNKKKSD